jgi:hypothetical protein
VIYIIDWAEQLLSRGEEGERIKIFSNLTGQSKIKKRVLKIYYKIRLKIRNCNVTRQNIIEVLDIAQERNITKDKNIKNLLKRSVLLKRDSYSR